MTLMLIIIMTSVILLSVLINLTMLKAYYTVKEKKTIKESYYQIQKVFQKDTVRKNDVDEIAKTYNYRVLISDGSGTIVYSSEGEKSLMYKSLWNILNENLDKISNQIKKQGYAVMTNTNKSMGTSINLMGYLDGDYTVIISTPMESIQTSARLSGQFTMYVGLILIICGAVAMYLYSRQFTKPIEDMAKAANQMSHLDFDVKVPTGSDDELGRLGASINELSSKLEFTISELKTANNELQKDIEQKVQIDEMRKEFLSHVSHELKTPITSMKILADSLLMQPDVPVELYEEFMNDIVHEIDRENQIITDLLTLVKMDKTQENLNISSVKINDLLEVLLKRISPIAEKRGIKIRLETMREVIAEVDEVKLSLACNNLIENAVKYNDDNGSVDVSLNADHKFFYIRVKDTGCGIPEDCQEQIFERFYRVDKARSRETGGTGLGLAITRNVILMHKGSIRVHSKEGEGSTFIIRIPLNYIG
mgnify:CR=1 FL=1